MYQSIRTPGRSAVTLNTFFQNGFVSLGEHPPSELVIGLVQRTRQNAAAARPTDAAGFVGLKEEGFIKIAMNFALIPQPEGRTLVTTETRVLSLDDRSRRLFRLYWLLIGPFSGLIRLEMLRLIRRQAERLRERN